LRCCGRQRCRRHRGRDGHAHNSRDERRAGSIQGPHFRQAALAHGLMLFSAAARRDVHGRTTAMLFCRANLVHRVHGGQQRRSRKKERHDECDRCEARLERFHDKKGCTVRARRIPQNASLSGGTAHISASSFPLLGNITGLRLCLRHPGRPERPFAQRSPLHDEENHRCDDQHVNR
jgi:hypothetical protein